MFELYRGHTLFQVRGLLQYFTSYWCAISRTVSAWPNIQGQPIQCCFYILGGGGGGISTVQVLLFKE